MTSPTDINVPTRSALVLETKASFLLLRFVNSDVSYYGHRISEKKKKGKENTANSHAKLTWVSRNQSLIGLIIYFFNDFFVNKGSTVIS